jgi:cation:H+ antiporter
MFFLVLTFLLCTAIIVVAGAGLSKYADLLANKTGIGKAWVGMTALGITTSLPELSSGISSVTYAGSVNIALGDALGSCVFNLGLIALIDFMSPDEPVLYKVGPGNMLSAGFGITVIGIIMLGLLIQPIFAVSFLNVSIFSLLVFPAYMAASKLTFSFEKRELSKFIREEAEIMKHDGVSVRKTVVMLVACALGVTVGGILLPKAGIRLADATGLGRGFVGSVFMAFSTSLPELVVTIAAVRMGSIDIAVGNVFGSNIFNCVVIGIDDLFYRKETIFLEAASGQVVTACIALVMTGVALIGLTYKSRGKKAIRLGWDSMALLGLYFLNILTSYYLSGGQ